MIRCKRCLTLLFTLGALLTSALAFALEPINTSLLSDVAVQGYDPVAYFVDGKPREGSRQHVHQWNGATWRFASAANRDRFAADPERYAPQYGGYCAWAVAQGYTAPIDSYAWKIVDGKLYLNYDKEVQAKWEKDIPRFIQQADTNWPRLLKEG